MGIGELICLRPVDARGLELPSRHSNKRAHLGETSVTVEFTCKRTKDTAINVVFRQYLVDCPSCFLDNGIIITLFLGFAFLGL